ncbi:MAG: phosphoglucomutase/phosphomannomutase family protein [Acidobacteria bacterium]|nr:phosphoglucomutase/phosphomannomutase family protein [Acidobacteriota bacterium]
MKIAFGTDGWRAVIGDGFTIENLDRVTQALALHLQNGSEGGSVAVGYDRRFMSGRFAERAALVLAGNGFQVELFDRPTPTPLVSFEVARRGHASGVVITASHNPAIFNGFKIKEQPGRSAAPPTVAAVEALIDRSPVRLGASADVALVEPPDGYDAEIARLVDLEAIRDAGVTIVADPIHGAGERAVERLLSGGRARVVTIRADRDPYFGGVNPEPIAQNLGALSEAVRREGALLGIATDGDADRLGAVDETGAFLTSQLTLAILVLHAAAKPGATGSIVKTVSQSRLVDRIARDRGFEVVETAIGFKYVADEIVKGDVLIGGEESGGFGIRTAIPERDGVLSGLLLAEAIVKSGMSPTGLVADIQKRYGPLVFDRRDLRIPPDIGLPRVAALAGSPPDRLAGLRVVDVNSIDGTKLRLEDESWLLLRQSGTEPMLRVYSEATSEALRDRLLDEGVALASGGR